MRHLLINLFVLTILFGSNPSLTLAQPYWDSTWTAQLNGDRIPDSIHLSRESAGMVFDARARIIFSGRQRSLTIRKTRYFNQMTSFVQLPYGTSISEDQPWVRQLKDQFTFKQKPGNKPEGSLAWLIDAYFSPSQTHTKFFNKVIHYDPVWQQGEPSVPEPYSIVIKGKIKDTLMTKWYYHFEELDERLPEATWLNYHTFWHTNGFMRNREPGLEKPVAVGPDYAVHATSHGLICYRNGHHSWCFISEMVTSGPNKLRWGSIHSVYIWKGLIFLVQNSAEFSQSLWVIDPIQGTAARVGDQWFNVYAHYSLHGTKGIKVENDKLITPAIPEDNVLADTLPLDLIKADLDSVSRR